MTVPINQMIESVAWSPDGNILAAPANNGQVQLVDKSGKSRQTLDAPGKAHELVWSKDGKILIAITENGSIQVWK